MLLLEHTNFTKLKTDHVNSKIRFLQQCKECTWNLTVVQPSRQHFHTTEKHAIVIKGFNFDTADPS